MGLKTSARVLVVAGELDIYDGIPSPASVVIKNIGVQTAYLGDTGVTSATGFPLDPGETISDTRESSEKWYAVAAVGTELAITIDTRTV